MKILTFDIEEWFHILDNVSTRSENEWRNYPSRIHGNMDRILSLLEKNQQRGTFFCLGWIAEKYPEVIRQIVDAGHDIGSHSTMHQLAYDQSRQEYKKDLERSIKVLEDITGQSVRYYRAPGFSITTENLWAFEELASHGIELDCSVFPGNHGHGGIPRYSHALPSIIEYQGISMKSLPINSVKLFGVNIIFSGGGYFRIAPLWLLDRWFRQSGYVMTYFHPRDFDAAQPVVPGLSMMRKFKSYVGLGGSLRKLETLLTRFDFCTVSEAEARTDWAGAPRVRLG
ncbi:MAG: polysaccharide deacetylase family protein [Gammaproteobacteria bacterium]|nr:polysaccharide deacetylase family protein [Gammaproteobacteria bacterium]